MGFVNAINISNAGAIPEGSAVAVHLLLFVLQNRRLPTERIQTRICSTTADCNNNFERSWLSWNHNCSAGCNPGQVWLAVGFDGPVEIDAIKLLSHDCITEYESSCTRSASLGYGKSAAGQVLWDGGVTISTAANITGAEWFPLGNRPAQNKYTLLWPSLAPSSPAPTPENTVEFVHNIQLNHSAVADPQTAAAEAAGTNIDGVAVATLFTVVVVFAVVIGALYRQEKTTRGVTKRLHAMSTKMVSVAGLDLEYEKPVTHNPIYHTAA